jgi:hypothetical protein
VYRGVCSTLITEQYTQPLGQFLNHTYPVLGLFVGEVFVFPLDCFGNLMHQIGSLLASVLFCLSLIHEE